jgi:hypothetical protein
MQVVLLLLLLLILPPPPMLLLLLLLLLMLPPPPMLLLLLIFRVAPCRQFNDAAAAAITKGWRIEVSQMIRFPISELVDGA